MAEEATSLLGQSICNKAQGKTSIPKVPKRFTTAMAMATSSLFCFWSDGARAAMALEPQMAVPKPTKMPVLPGQLNRFERKNDRKSTAKTTNATPTKG